MTMKLYKAVDKLDGRESFFLVYPDNTVATMYCCSVETVRANACLHLRDPVERFNDAIDPVLIAEW